MKKILIISLFSLISIFSFGQQIDENGRPAGQTKSVAGISVVEKYLAETKTEKSAGSFTINYSLPAGKNSGELRFFHPQKDQELKKVTLEQTKGTVSYPKSDFNLKGVIVALYSENKLIETLNLLLEK
ncbi:MAG: hypothetical protein U0V04_08650 [Spirosomataceae bacterium]